MGFQMVGLTPAMLLSLQYFYACSASTNSLALPLVLILKRIKLIESIISAKLIEVYQANRLNYIRQVG